MIFHREGLQTISCNNYSVQYPHSTLLKRLSRIVPPRVTNGNVESDCCLSITSHAGRNGHSLSDIISDRRASSRFTHYYHVCSSSEGGSVAGEASVSSKCLGEPAVVFAPLNLHRFRTQSRSSLQLPVVRSSSLSASELLREHRTLRSKFTATLGQPFTLSSPFDRTTAGLTSKQSESSHHCPTLNVPHILTRLAILKVEQNERMSTEEKQTSTETPATAAPSAPASSATTATTATVMDPPKQEPEKDKEEEEVPEERQSISGKHRSSVQFPWTLHQVSVI